MNANKGGHSSRRAKLLAWIDRTRPEVLFLQEPWRAGQDPLAAIGPLRFIQGNSNVAAYAREPADFTVARFEDRWLTLHGGGAALHGVYFHCETGERRQRAELLDRLAAAVQAVPMLPHIVVGDFNLAPTHRDGLYGGNPSRWTSEREREALRSLLATGGLIDATFAPKRPNGFTFERAINGRRLQFRCDLALVDGVLHESGDLIVGVDHGVRIGSGAFTDHSALIVDLGGVETYPVRTAKVEDPRARGEIAATTLGRGGAS